MQLMSKNRIKAIRESSKIDCSLAAFLVLVGFIVGRIQANFFLFLVVPSPAPPDVDNIHLMESQNVDAIKTTSQQQQQQVMVRKSDGNRHSNMSNNKNTMWHTVNVYTGGDRTQQQLLQSELRTMGIIENSNQRFSQCGQDMYVLGLLQNKKRGYFIDLAANNAIYLSNTLALERQADWNGLCIEPNPAYWYSLAYHRKCEVVVAVVGGGGGGGRGGDANQTINTVQFAYKGAYGEITAPAASASAADAGGLDNKNKNKTDGTTASSSSSSSSSAMIRTVPSVSLLDIFKHFDVPRTIDYLSLDVEGAEYVIMKDFPFDLYTFSILTVERPKKDLKSLLQKHGYKVLKRLSKWGESLWAHESTMITMTAQQQWNMSALNESYVEVRHGNRYEPQFMFGG